MTEKILTKYALKTEDQLSELYKISIQDGNISCALKCLELKLKYLSAARLSSVNSLELKDITDENLLRWIEELKEQPEGF